MSEPPPGPRSTGSTVGGEDDRAAFRALAWYRRAGAPQYADTIGTVLGSATAGPLGVASVEQLAADLSGGYGPFWLKFTGEFADAGVELEGRVHDEHGAEVGAVIRRFVRTPDSDEIVAHHVLQRLVPLARHREFGSSLQREMDVYYRRSSVVRIELYAGLEDGGYVWAKAGYLFDPSPDRLRHSLRSVRNVAAEMRDDAAASASDRRRLEAVIASLDPDADDIPPPKKLAALATNDSPDLGQTLMRRAHWYGVRYL